MLAHMLQWENQERTVVSLTLMMYILALSDGAVAGKR